MKHLRILIAIIAVILVLATSGCSKTWSTNFTLVSDIDDWNKVDFADPRICALEPEGLRIVGYWVEAPYEFRGDFTVSYNFVLDTNVDRKISYIRMNVDDGNNSARANMVEVYLRNVGDPATEIAQVLMRGSGVQTEILSFPLELNRDGDNVLKIIKRGNSFKIRLNTTEVVSFEIDDYASPYAINYFIPGIYSHTDTGGLLHFNSISVTYDGTMAIHAY